MIFAVRTARRTYFQMIRQNLAKIQKAMVPISSGAVSISDIVILDDNLAEDYHSQNRDTNPMRDIAKGSPFRQMMCFLAICRSGQAVFKINLKEYVIGPGGVMLCYPGMIVESIKISDDCKGAMIAFAHETFFPDSSIPCIKTLRRFMLSPLVLQLDEKRSGMLFTSYNLLKSTLQKDDYEYKKDTIQGGLHIVAAMLAQWVSMANTIIPDSPKSRDESLFLGFISDVQRNCFKERKISFYAEKFCISPKYFARLIYNTSGRHPSEWIKDYVIMEAKAMLRSGSLTVQQVSDALNFPNSSFFGKYFKSEVGQSPREYIIESR